MEGIVQTTIQDIAVGPGGHLAVRIQPVRDSRERSFHGRLHRIRPDAHELGEVVRGEVIGPDGVPVPCPG